MRNMPINIMTTDSTVFATEALGKAFSSKAFSSKSLYKSDGLVFLKVRVQNDLQSHDLVSSMKQYV